MPKTGFSHSANSDRYSARPGVAVRHQDDRAAMLGHEQKDRALPRDQSVPPPHRAAVPVKACPAEAPRVEPGVNSNLCVGSTQRRKRRILASATSANRNMSLDRREHTRPRGAHRPATPMALTGTGPLGGDLVTRGARLRSPASSQTSCSSIPAGDEEVDLHRLLPCKPSQRFDQATEQGRAGVRVRPHGGVRFSQRGLRRKTRQGLVVVCRTPKRRTRPLRSAAAGNGWQAGRARSHARPRGRRAAPGCGSRPSPPMRRWPASASTSRRPVATIGFVKEPSGNLVSDVTGSPVDVSASPWYAVVLTPSRRMPMAAPGTECFKACSCSRPARSSSLTT